jgi:hypothetical protein
MEDMAIQHVKDIQELTTHSAHLVERIEALKLETKPTPDLAQFHPLTISGFNEALDQAIDIVKDKSDKQEV